MANILIAEDERDIRELINFTLSFAGHKVTEAPNGEKALELAKEMQPKPELIMMDVRMPKMTGYEACRQMKQIDQLKDIPVVFLSAKGQDEEVQTGIEVGAVAYILKPFSPDDLTRRVKEIIEQEQAAQTTTSSDKPAAERPQQPATSDPQQAPARDPKQQPTTSDPQQQTAGDPQQ